MQLNAIETFIAVVDAGSMTLAARRLGLSKSVVSERLRWLEADLNTRLLQRSTRRMGLTDAGKTFYERVKRIVQELRQAREAVAAPAKELRGVLRIAAPASFGARHLGPALYAFMEVHPLIELDVDLSDRKVDLIAAGYDMAVRIGRPEGSSMIARALAQSRRVVVCSPHYAKRHGMPRTLAQLSAHRAVDYRFRKGAADWQFQVGNEVKNLQLHARLQVNSGELHRDAAAAGLGLALVPTFLIDREVADGTLVVVPLSARAVPDQIFALYPQNRHVSVKARALTAFLRERFGAPPYWDRIVQASAERERAASE